MIQSQKMADGTWAVIGCGRVAVLPKVVENAKFTKCDLVIEYARERKDESGQILKHCAKVVIYDVSGANMFALAQSLKHGEMVAFAGVVSEYSFENQATGEIVKVREIRAEQLVPTGRLIKLLAKNLKAAESIQTAFEEKKQRNGEDEYLF